VRLDTGASPAEFLFGTTLRIPGEFVTDNDFTADPKIFVEDFRAHIRNCKLVPVNQGYKKRTFYFKDLATCTHVFLCNDVKQLLERSCSGPYKIVQRISDKVYALEIRGKTINVSIGRVKPAYFVPDLAEKPADNTPNQLSDSTATTQSQPYVLKTYLGAKKQVHFSYDT